MNKFIAGLDHVLAFTNLAAALCIFGMAALVLSEIVARAAFDYSIKLVWEVGSYLLAASWFLAAGYTLRTCGHVRLNVLTGKLPARMQRPVEIFSTAVALGICCALWTAVVMVFRDSVIFAKTSFTPLQTPLWIPQAVMVVGATLLVLAMAVRLYLALAGKEPDLPFAGNE